MIKQKTRYFIADKKYWPKTIFVKLDGVTLKAFSAIDNIILDDETLDSLIAEQKRCGTDMHEVSHDEALRIYWLRDGVASNLE